MRFVFWPPHTCMNVLLHTQTHEHINKAVPQHMSMKILCTKSQYLGTYWKKGIICTLLTFFIFPHHWQFGFYARVGMRLVKLIFFQFFEEKCAPKQSCYKVPTLLSDHGRILSSVKLWIGRKQNFPGLRHPPLNCILASGLPQSTSLKQWLTKLESASSSQKFLSGFQLVLGI